MYETTKGSERKKLAEGKEENPKKYPFIFFTQNFFNVKKEKEYRDQLLGEIFAVMDARIREKIVAENVTGR